MRFVHRVLKLLVCAGALLGGSTLLATTCRIDTGGIVVDVPYGIIVELPNVICWDCGDDDDDCWWNDCDD